MKIALTKPKASCPKCLNLLSTKNVTKGYSYFCPECDEDFYTIEVKLITEIYHQYTIEYKTYLIHVNNDGTAYTYFGDFKSLLAAKQGVSKYRGTL